MANEQWATPEQIERSKAIMARLNAEAEVATTDDDIAEHRRGKVTVSDVRREERQKAAIGKAHLLARLDRLTEGTGRMRERMMAMERQRAQVLSYIIELQVAVTHGPKDDNRVQYLMQLLRDSLVDVG